MKNIDLQELIKAFKDHLPKNTTPIIYVLIILTVASWIPLALITKARATKSTKPRVHIFQDMDNQPRYRPQHSNNSFADTRAMRPRIEHTVARDELFADDHLHVGLKTNDDGLAVDASGNVITEAAKLITDAQWFNDFPESLNIDKDFLERGREQYDIFCAVCHGQSGNGNGYVHQFVSEKIALGALSGKQHSPGWAQPADLLSSTTRKLTLGQLYYTVTNGKIAGKMAGYRSQVNVNDRWAIVAYVKALHESAPVTPEPETNDNNSQPNTNTPAVPAFVLPPEQLAVAKKNIEAALKLTGNAQRGSQLYLSKTCMACHTNTGLVVVGPTWKGIYGTEELISTGEKVKVDDAYIIESIFNPGTKITVKPDGTPYPGMMIPLPMTPQEAADIVAYIKTLK